MVTPFPQMVNRWVCDTIPVNGMWTSPSRWHLTQFQRMPGGPIPVDGLWPNPGDRMWASPSGCCVSQVSGRALRKDDLFQASRRDNLSLSLWVLSNLDVISGIAVAILLCPAEAAIKEGRALRTIDRSETCLLCLGPTSLLRQNKNTTNKQNVP